MSKNKIELMAELDAINVQLNLLLSDFPGVTSIFYKLKDEYKLIESREINKIRQEERENAKLKKATEQDKVSAAIAKAEETDKLWERLSIARSNFYAMERELSIAEKLCTNLQSQLKALGAPSGR